MHMRNVALEFLERGFSVIPIERESKSPASRWAPYQYRPPSAQTVRAWWRENEEYNVGIITAAGASEEVRRLVIFDFDKRDRYESDRGRLPDKTWVASTGRSHGKHVYVLAPEPIRTYGLDGLDIKGLGSFCVAPPSVHEGGRRYKFEQQPQRIASVSWRDLEHFGIEPLSSELNRRRPSWIPHEAWLILSGFGGEISSGYATRSEYEHAAICALIGVGAKLETIHEVFRIHAHSASKFQTIRKSSGDRQAARWIEVSYRAAVRHMERQWASVRASLDAMLERLPGLRLPGGRSGNLQAVYGAFVRQARNCRKTELNVSVRELAEHAGLSASGALAQIRNLSAVGLVHCIRTNQKNLSNRYLLPDYVGSLEKQPSPYTPEGGSCDECTLSGSFDPESFLRMQDHDLFSAAGLGKIGLTIWIAICDASQEGLRTSAIVSATAVSQSSVQRVGARMQEIGLVKKTGMVWRAIPDVDLDQAAQKAGAAGCGVERKLRHISERVGFESTLGLDRREHHRRRALMALGIGGCPDSPDANAPRLEVGA